MSEKKIPYKIYLEEHEMPKQWYNVRADMKNKPAPLLNPATHEPMSAEELGAVFCKGSFFRSFLSSPFLLSVDKRYFLRSTDDIYGTEQIW